MESRRTNEGSLGHKIPGNLGHFLYCCLAGAVVLPAALSIAATWATPKQVGDLFIALAGGRDVVGGALGKPDQWSFITNGRVWINQNWLSHLLIYVTWQLGGETGLLVLKAALLTAMAALLYLLGRRCGADRLGAILLASGLMIACSQFVALRANLSTLVMMPLAMWLLHRGFEGRQRIWWMLPVQLVWANLHGGFVFGLGMMGLWAVCVTVQDWRRLRRNPLARDWPLWACTACCIAVSAVSPFGLENLSHPLVIATSESWRQVPEWRPLLTKTSLPTPWAFFVVLGLAVFLGVLRLAIMRVKRKADSATSATTVTGSLPFDLLLVIITVLMAIRSQRFVPLAIIASAAPLACSSAWFVKNYGRKCIAVLAVCVLAALAPLVRKGILTYHPDNPAWRGSGVFDRMHAVSEEFPASAARFLSDNGLEGNVLSTWEWEGYLRWVYPRVRILIGGRAQQIYTEDDLAAYSRLRDPAVAADWLAQHQTHLAVLSTDPHGNALMLGLLGSGRWACIYSDGKAMVLADSSSALAQRAMEDGLKYPKESIRALSRSMCLATTPARPASVLAAIKEANAISPSPQAYYVAGNLGATPSLRPEVIAYLEEEASRLPAMPQATAERLTILYCRQQIQTNLAQLYPLGGDDSQARLAQAKAIAIFDEINALRAAWK